MTDLVELCAKAVRAAKRAGAEQAEAFALSERGSGVEIEKGSPSEAAWDESRGVGIRVLKAQQVGFAYATSPERLAEASRGALKAARLGRRLAGFGFAGPSRALRVAGLHDPRVAAVGSETLLEHAKAMADSVRDVRPDLLVAGGSVAAGETEVAIANSEGLERHHRDTGFGAHCYVVQRRDGVSTGFAGKESTRLDVKPEAVGREAGDLAVRSSKPTRWLRGGPVPCVVRPEPASDLLSTVTVPALYGKPAQRGESYYSGKLGRRVVHDAITLVDDPTQAGGLGSAPFDDDGTPTRAVRPIARGVLKAYLYDRYDAAEWDARSTGHAVRSHPFDGRSFKSPPGTSALNLRLEAPRTTTDKLVASLDRGLVLHDLMGVHTANTVSGDFSVTASVLFEVRKGRIEGPVAPLSIAGNVHTSLRAGIRLGDDEKAMGGAPAWRLPSVLFEGLTATP